MSVEKADLVRGRARELQPCPGKAQEVFHLRRLKEANQPDEVVPASHRRQLDRVKVCRLRRLSVAEAEANPASDLQNPVPQVARREQGEKFRHRRKVVARRRED